MRTTTHLPFIPKTRFHGAGLFKNAKYVTCISALILIAILCESCYIVDDDNINAVCTGQCTTIQGRFTTKDGNTGMSAMNLRLEWYTRDALGLFAKTRKIASTQTDEAGNYHISFYVKDEEISNGSYQLHYQVPDETYSHNPLVPYISFPSLKRDTTITRNFHLPKLDATIHFRLTNPEALGPDDRLFCLVIYEYDDLEHDEIYGVGALNAPNLIESTYTTASDQFTYIRTTKVKNGMEQVSLDSVMIGSGQTVEYDVEF
jgi:5-hydroxyisourate hydrolase-like protein (transthyretin family)